MISDARTVHHTVFEILINKKFQVWYDEKNDDYWAEKEGWDFRASDFVELLGLIAIYEEIKPVTPDFLWWKEGLDYAISLTEVDTL